MKIREIITEIGAMPPAPASTVGDTSSDAAFAPLGNKNEPDQREVQNRKVMKDSEMSPFTQQRVKVDMSNVQELLDEEDEDE